MFVEQPEPKALKRTEIEHAANLENVMRQQALLRIDGPHLTRSVRHIESPLDSLPFPAGQPSNQLPAGVKVPFWFNALSTLSPIFASIGDAAARWQSLQHSGASLIARAREDAPRAQSLQDYYAAVGMKSVWSHFDSLRALVLRLVIGDNVSSIPAALDERQWWLREHCLDTAFVWHAIQIPAVAAGASTDGPLQIQWQRRTMGLCVYFECLSFLFVYCFFLFCSTGLVVFHSDPKFARLAFMKSPPVTMHRNDLYVFSFLRNSLARQALRVPSYLRALAVKAPPADKDSSTPLEVDASTEIDPEPAIDADTAAFPEASLDHAAELQNVIALVGADHYQSFRLRHAVACFDKYAQRAEVAAVKKPASNTVDTTLNAPPLAL
jgi:hypothetical protein